MVKIGPLLIGDLEYASSCDKVRPRCCLTTLPPVSGVLFIHKIIKDYIYFISYISSLLFFDPEYRDDAAAKNEDTAENVQNSQQDPLLDLESLGLTEGSTSAPQHVKVFSPLIFYLL